MPARAQRGSLVQELTRTNPWWRDPRWETTDPHLLAAARAPYERQPAVLNDITPPNLYTLRGPRRVGKSTLLKQTIARLSQTGVDSRRICYFAADALSSFTDLINLFQAARLLFPDLGDPIPPSHECALRSAFYVVRNSEDRLHVFIANLRRRVHSAHRECHGHCRIAHRASGC